MKNTILELSRIISPPGGEDGVRDYVTGKIGGAERETDLMGNLIVHLPKNADGEGERIMISASMDEPVFIVNDADVKGRVRFALLGDLDLASAQSSAAEFENGTAGSVVLLERDKKDDVLSYCADIGAASKEDALAAAPAGTCLRPAGIVSDSAEDFVSAPSSAAKAGVAVLLAVYEKLKNENRKNDVYLAFTAQGKVGARGAGPAAARIKPHRAVSVESLSAGKETGRKAGQGPCVLSLCERFVPDPDVTEALKRAAGDAGVPCFVVADNKTGVTDASAIQRTGAGAPSGVIAVPAKYRGSPSETVYLSDLEGAAEVVARFCIS